MWPGGLASEGGKRHLGGQFFTRFLVDWPLCNEFQTHFTDGLGNWSFDNDCVERGKAGQRIPGWNWEEKSGDEKEKVSLSGFFRGTFSAFSDERTRRLITTRFS